MLLQGAIELSPHLLQQEAPEGTGVTLVRVMEVALPVPVIFVDTPTTGCVAQLDDWRVIDRLLGVPVKLITVPE